MKLIVSLFLSLAALQAQAQTCQNQALACRISTAAADMASAAGPALHANLEDAADALWDVATDYCRCDFSEYTPGSGILMQRYNYVKQVYANTAGITQPEANAMQALRSAVGQ